MLIEYVMELIIKPHALLLSLLIYCSFMHLYYMRDFLSSVCLWWRLSVRPMAYPRDPLWLVVVPRHYPVEHRSILSDVVPLATVAWLLSLSRQFLLPFPQNSKYTNIMQFVIYHSMNNFIHDFCKVELYHIRVWLVKQLFWHTRNFVRAVFIGFFQVWSRTIRPFVNDLPQGTRSVYFSNFLPRDFAYVWVRKCRPLGFGICPASFLLDRAYFPLFLFA